LVDLRNYASVHNFQQGRNKMDLTLNLDTNVAYALLAAIVAVVLIVSVAKILRLRYMHLQGYDLETTQTWPTPKQ
jgi:hypothetical protein